MIGGRSPRPSSTASSRASPKSGLVKEEKHVLQSELDEISAVLQYDLTPKTQGLALFADGEGGLYQR